MGCRTAVVALVLVLASAGALLSSSVAPAARHSRLHTPTQGDDSDWPGRRLAQDFLYAAADPSGSGSTHHANHKALHSGVVPGAGGPQEQRDHGSHHAHASHELSASGDAGGGGHSLSGHAAAGYVHRELRDHITVPRGFVYVYELPPKYNLDTLDLPVQWSPEQYDIDQVMHKHLLRSAVRTIDPEQAKLFFIPTYLGRYFNHVWQRYSDPRSAWNVTKECHDLPPWDCWTEKWQIAQNASSELVRGAIEHVKATAPYWGRNNGADHFMVFSFDHARCDQARALDAHEFGQLFSIQAYGDLSYRSRPDVQAVQVGTKYEWPGPHTWACYRPDVDILVPVYSRNSLEDLVSPFANPRNISMLMRFDYDVTDGKSLVAHHGHRLRAELIEAYHRNPLPGSDLGVRSTKETEEDMRRAVFCVCPPGNTQDSARVWRAIIKGCLPVTFFRANDLPFARHLGVPWREFALNIQPDDYLQLHNRVQRLLNHPAKLRRMQEALERHQKLFVWDERDEDGIFASVEKELALRASLLQDEPHIPMVPGIA